MRLDVREAAESVFHRPFLVFFLLMLFFHFCVIGQPIRDDLEYAKDYTEVFHGDFFHAVIWRYQSWSSRVLSDWTTYFFAHGHYALWKLIDSFACLIIVRSMYGIFSRLFREHHTIYKWLLMGIFLLYPLQDLSGAGWMATTINYLWNYACMLFFCEGVCRRMVGEHLFKWEYFLYLLALVISVDFEQTIVWDFVIVNIWVGYAVYRRKSLLLPAVAYGIILMGSAFVALSPGNMVRFVFSMKDSYPYFEMLSFVDRLNLGIVSTFFYFTDSFSILYAVFWLQSVILIWSRYRNKLYRLYSLMPVLFIAALRKIPVVNGPVMSMRGYPEINAENMTSVLSFMPSLLSLMLLLWPCILLYIIFEDDLKIYGIAMALYFTGMSGRFLMGFSPTLYVSGERTQLTIYLALILLNLFLCKRIRDTLSAVFYRCWFAGLFITALVSFIRLCSFTRMLR